VALCFAFVAVSTASRTSAAAASTARFAARARIFFSFAKRLRVVLCFAAKSFVRWACAAATSAAAALRCLTRSPCSLPVSQHRLLGERLELRVGNLAQQLPHGAAVARQQAQRVLLALQPLVRRFGRRRRACAAAPLQQRRLGPAVALAPSLMQLLHVVGQLGDVALELLDAVFALVPQPPLLGVALFLRFAPRAQQVVVARVVQRPLRGVRQHVVRFS
jgi:hypothetical protein